MSSTALSGFNVSNVARIGVFAALALGINAPLLAVPNVEIFSLTLFLSGLFLGKANGTVVALTAGIIFIFFNPNGPQPILFVGIAQIFGFLLFGLAGGVLRPTILKNYDAAKTTKLLVIIGALLTIYYDLSTNIVFAVIFGPFWPVLISGLGFGLIHFVSNSIIFGLSGTIVYKVWRRIEYIMPPLAG